MNDSTPESLPSPSTTRLLQALSGAAAQGEMADAWSVAPPIFQTSTFAYPSTQRAAESCGAVHPNDCYSRYGNPNFTSVERAICELEGTEAALLTGSGMGAISLVLTGLLQRGDHVVAQRTHYAATLQALQEWLPRWGIEVTQVDQTDVDAFAAALRPNTRLILAETPANPLLAITDLAEVAALARSHGVITCVDNTLATPINQRPKDLGIDLVVHSATKYFGGHSDVTAGVIAGTRQVIDHLWRALIVFGMVPHPFEAWLLGRGLQTLPLRVARHNDNASRLAAFLEEHPAVERVHYPGLPTHPQHELARRQMSGFGGLLSFEVARGYDAARQLVDGLKLVDRAVSLGGTHSLAVHVASMIYPHVTPGGRERAGIDDRLIRVAVGLEDPDSIIGDFAQALGQADAP